MAKKATTAKTKVSGKTLYLNEDYVEIILKLAGSKLGKSVIYPSERLEITGVPNELTNEYVYMLIDKGLVIGYFNFPPKNSKSPIAVIYGLSWSGREWLDKRAKKAKAK